MAAVWPGIAVTDDSLVQCIGEIRRAIGDEAHAVVRTVPRRGYRLVPAAPSRRPRGGIGRGAPVAGRRRRRARRMRGRGGWLAGLPARTDRRRDRRAARGRAWCRSSISPATPPRRALLDGLRQALLRARTSRASASFLMVRAAGRPSSVGSSSPAGSRSTTCSAARSHRDGDRLRLTAEPHRRADRRDCSGRSAGTAPSARCSAMQAEVTAADRQPARRRDRRRAGARAGRRRAPAALPTSPPMTSTCSAAGNCARPRAPARTRGGRAARPRRRARSRFRPRLGRAARPRARSLADFGIDPDAQPAAGLAAGEAARSSSTRRTPGARGARRPATGTRATSCAPGRSSRPPWS